jgi:hypothetical protein
MVGRRLRAEERAQEDQLSRAAAPTNGVRADEAPALMACNARAAQLQVDLDAAEARAAQASADARERSVAAADVL